jgi:hypothetical protein
MRFTSPLYGFYDITNDNSCREGYGHITQQSIEKIDILHDTYFKYIYEYENNSKIFIEYFIKHKNKIKEFINSKIEPISVCQKLI